jgi:hypothetical protein
MLVHLAYLLIIVVVVNVYDIKIILAVHVVLMTQALAVKQYLMKKAVCRPSRQVRLM